MQNIVNVGTPTLTNSSTGLGIKGKGVQGKIGRGKSATPIIQIQITTPNAAKLEHAVNDT
jgi:hypothetical protein